VENRQTAPVTLATYQILSYRSSKDGEVPAFPTVQRSLMGLIIYDEVHLLPAPIFRITANCKRRRLGLTAADSRRWQGRRCLHADWSQRYDVPWRELEAQGLLPPPNVAKFACRKILIARWNMR